MNTVIANICFGYLIGLALLGYVGVLAQIKILAKDRVWSHWLSNIIIGLHFLIGICSVIYLPITLFNSISGASSELESFAFAITLIFMVVIMISASWNRKLELKKGGH